MAAINFPNPGTQTPPNTFSPSSTPAKTVNGLTYVWNGVGWRIRSTQGEGGGTKVIISETAPGDAFAGDLWWDSGEPASLFIYYIDNDSKQWVPATPVTSGWYVNGGELVTAETGINVRVGGNITATGTIRAEQDANTWVNINGNGVIAQNPNADTSNVFFRGRSSGGDNKVSLFTDGSASFLSDTIILDNIGGGRVVVGSTATNGPRVQLTQNGVIQSFTPNTDLGVISIYQDGTEKVTLNNNGSASLAGQISVGTLSYDGTCFSGMNDGSNIMFFGQAAPANAIIYSCTQAGSGNARTFSVTAEGTVTSKGNILTRASGNMNVGDELENAKNALTAIKAAATDSSTDLAGMKAAIVAALTNH